jgi:protein-S-isoprenylcysteine O-methyltransferase Ste14
MSYAGGVIFICLAMAIVIAMVYQALAFARGRHIITRGQLGLRMATGVLLLVTIGLVFYAAVTRFTDPTTALVFWSLLTVLPLAVIVLAWLDLRQVARAQHRRQAELYRNLANLEYDLRSKPEDHGSRE